MAETVVWAPRPLKRLRMKTGMVICDEEMAKQLLAEDLVQDPRVGARHLREIEEKAVEAEEEPVLEEQEHKQTYSTRQLKAKK